MVLRVLPLTMLPAFKGYLSTFSSYGSAALDYIKELAPVTENMDHWTKPAKYGKCIYHYSGKSMYLTQTYIYLPSSLASANVPVGYPTIYNSSSNKWTIHFKYLSNTALRLVLYMALICMVILLNMI